MLASLFEFGKTRYGDTIYKTKYDLALVTRVEAYEKSLEKIYDETNDTRTELAKLMALPQFDQYEFVHFTQTVADHIRYRTVKSANLIARHSYKRRFYSTKESVRMQIDLFMNGFYTIDPQDNIDFHLNRRGNIAARNK